MPGLSAGLESISLPALEARLKEVEEELSRREPIQSPDHAQRGVASEIWTTISARKKGQLEAAASASASSQMASTVALITCCEKAISVLGTLMAVTSRLDWDTGESAATSVADLCTRTEEVIAAEQALLSLPPSAVRETFLQDARQLRLQARDMLIREGMWRLLSVEQGRLCLLRPRRSRGEGAQEWSYARLLGLISRTGGAGEVPHLTRAVGDKVLACLVDPVLRRCRPRAPDVLQLTREVSVTPEGEQEAVVLSLLQRPAGEKGQPVLEAVERLLAFFVDDVLEGRDELVALFQAPLFLPVLQRLSQHLTCAPEWAVSEAGVKEQQSLMTRLLGGLDRVLLPLDAAVWRDHLLSLASVSVECRQQRSLRTRCLSRAREHLPPSSSHPSGPGMEELWRAALCAEEGEGDVQLAMPGALRQHTSRDLLAWLQLLEQQQQQQQQGAVSSSDQGLLGPLGRRLEATGHRARRRVRAAASSVCPAFSPSLMDVSLSLHDQATNVYESRVRSRVEELVMSLQTGHGEQRPQRPREAGDTPQQHRPASVETSTDRITEALSQAREALGPLPADAARRAGLCLVDTCLDVVVASVLQGGGVAEDEAARLGQSWQALDHRCLRTVSVPDQAARELAAGPRPWRLRLVKQM